MSHKLAECSIRVTVLLEYQDLAVATRSWLSNHNSVVRNPILLYYCKDFLGWVFQLHTYFQLTALSGLLGRRANYWYFYSQISFVQLLHTLGFVSYLRDLYFDCFQTTKRHSYNSCSIHNPIFSSFHEAVYPVGITTNRSFFLPE